MQEFKNINISLYGKIEDIRQRPKSTSIKLVSSSGMVVWCFVKNIDDIDLESFRDKHVCCMGTASRTPFTNAEGSEILGYQTTYNIFRIADKFPRPVHKNYKLKTVIDG